MMTQSNVLELAKLGNAEAIATLINRCLQPKGITAKASLKENCLRVVLEAEQVPDKGALVKFIQTGLIKLKIESIKMVIVYGKQSEQDSPAWRYQFNLLNQAEPITRPPGQSNSSSTDLSLNLNGIKPAKNTSVGRGNEHNKSDLAKFSVETSKIKDATPKTQQEVFKEIGKALISYKVWSRVFLLLIGLRLAFDILFVFYSLTWASSYYILEVVDVVDPTKFLARGFYLLFRAIDFLGAPLKSAGDWLYLFTGVITVIWLHRLHAQLKVLFKGYPISPWGAIARYLIPFYSLWGIWNLFATLAKKLKSQSGDLVRWGASLQRWLPWLYISLMVSIAFRLVYIFLPRAMYEPVTYVVVFVMNNIMRLVLTVIWLQIAIFISKAVGHKLHNP